MSGGRLRLLVVVLASLLAAGCSAASTEDVPAAVDEMQGSSPLTIEEVGRLGMSVDAKRTQMPEGFPFQVPVLDGRIVDASVYDQGNGVWIYRIEAPVPPEIAAEWYRRSYTIANWVPTDERRDDASGAVTLEFSKGEGAETVVTVRPGSDNGSDVEATVGLGAPSSDTL